MFVGLSQNVSVIRKEKGNVPKWNMYLWQAHTKTKRNDKKLGNTFCFWCLIPLHTSLMLCPKNIQNTSSCEIKPTDGFASKSMCYYVTHALQFV